MLNKTPSIHQGLKHMYDMIERYIPLYQEEIDYKRYMLDFISNNPDCLLRSCTTGHFTSSSLLLNTDMTRICLMHHAKLKKWLQLGGHCDGDSDLLNVAIKEAQEESGITDISPVQTDIFDIDVHLIPENPKDKSHYHLDVRFLLRANNDKLIKNHESSDLMWVDINDNIITDNITRMVRKFSIYKERL